MASEGDESTKYSQSPSAGDEPACKVFATVCGTHTKNGTP